MHGGDTSWGEFAASIARREGAARSWIVRADVDSVLGLLGALGPFEFATVLGGMPIACADVRALARGSNLALVVDKGMVGSSGCSPVRLGAQLSLGELARGCVCAAVSGDADERLPGLCELLDGLPALRPESPAAPAARRAAGMRHHRGVSDAAAVVAAYLSCHPRVAEVRYPGLKSDPSFEVASRTLLGGFGAVVDYALRGESGRWHRVICDEGKPTAQVLRLEEILDGRRCPP